MKTIAFDFDGVIHKYSRGWLDGSIYNDINIEVLLYMKELLKKYSVVIYSTRNPKQIIERLNKISIGLKYEECKDIFWNKLNVIGVSNKKPTAILYIDDRGYRYIPELSTELNIKMIDNVLRNLENIDNGRKKTFF